MSFAGSAPSRTVSRILRPHPVVSSLFSFLGATIHGMHVWITLDDTRRPFRVASDEDRHGPAAATGVAQGTTHTCSMGAWCARCAGTLDRGPGGVKRSIGQSIAPCQKQNGTFRGVSWCVSRRHASGRHDATAYREELYLLCHPYCMATSAEASGVNEKMLRRWLHQATAFQEAYHTARR